MTSTRSVREGLIEWDKTRFDHVRGHVKELEKQLEALMEDPISARIVLEEGSCVASWKNSCLERKFCGSSEGRLNGLLRKIGTLFISMRGLVLGGVRTLCWNG
ncbi:UNVERIFIED_CONTAM: hypothetical protein Slati_3114600 [Sesamum latifolium]|uniref:Uncharacterized protein n=1 Tax=Sesamum latifolium TaxID=2727402 RepID=A0AAW2UWT4_9LAMI